ncbi:MAG: hypothetical protein WBR30_23310, partial [Candidatus Sulfotelmatobacter sp.]
MSEIFSSSKRDDGALSSSGQEGDLGGVENSDFMGDLLKSLLSRFIETPEGRQLGCKILMLCIEKSAGGNFPLFGSFRAVRQKLLGCQVNLLEIHLSIVHISA